MDKRTDQAQIARTRVKMSLNLPKRERAKRDET